jgi:spastin
VNHSCTISSRQTTTALYALTKRVWYLCVNFDGDFSLCQLEGCNTFNGAMQAATDSRVIVIGATNRPADLDDAVCRRLSRRVFVPLPDPQTRRRLFEGTLLGASAHITDDDLHEIASATEGYSGSDIASLCKEAAMRPIRELPAETLATVEVGALRALRLGDLKAAMAIVRPSVPGEALHAFELWNAKFGSDVGCL